MLAASGAWAEAFDIDGIINTMISLEREPDRVKKEIADTVSAIQKTTGKSLRLF